MFEYFLNIGKYKLDPFSAVDWNEILFIRFVVSILFRIGMNVIEWFIDSPLKNMYIQKIKNTNLKYNYLSKNKKMIIISSNNNIFQIWFRILWKRLILSWFVLATI